MLLWIFSEMQLTWTRPGSWMCLLLLVSNLLLWEHATSKPNTLVSTKDLYHRVVEQSRNAYVLSAEIYQEFVFKFFKTSWFANGIPNICHTASIRAPENRMEVNETKTEDLLKIVINISHAWEEPLKHLVSAVSTLQGASDNMLRKVSAMKDRHHVLLEGLNAILNRSQIEVEENAYPAWSGLADLQSSDEDTHLFAFYGLARCLKRDCHKTDTYLKVLRCRVTYKNECPV